MMKIVVPSYKSLDSLKRCMVSISEQDYTDYQVCVIDDGSKDLDQKEFIEGWTASAFGDWECIIHEENKGALYSQVEAIRNFDCGDDDIIVFLDGDDRLHGHRALSRLAAYYKRFSPTMTYGNFMPVPPSRTCYPAEAYPFECVISNDYRNIERWGLRANHLRTIKYGIFKHLNEEDDFLDEDGSWYHVAGDTAVMVPCLELSGGNHLFIDEVLLEYTSDSPLADWRLNAPEINRIHARIARGRRKQKL